MFPQKNKLKSSEFSNIYTKGIKLKGVYGMLIYTKTINTPLKIGIVVNSKIGNAVKRNKMTRRIRSIFSEYLKEDKYKGYSMEYILFSYTDDFALLKEDLTTLFTRIKE